MPSLCKLRVSTFALLAIAGLAAGQALPAFPGAEGEGMWATGGRGGDVYHVTNLNNDGVGSLRYGLQTASGPRTIVFDIGGTIELTSPLGIYPHDITIAGQTAPGGGICIKNYDTKLYGNNAIIRHLRFRPGDERLGLYTEDSLTVRASNVIIDHCTATWSVDEALSMGTAAFDNVTIQYCIIAQALDQTGYYHGSYNPDYLPGGPKHHGYGSLWKPRDGTGVIGRMSAHHNLWALNNNRNPAVGTYNTDDIIQLDFRNNVLYGNVYNGYSSGASLRVEMNYVGNYIIAGPDTDSNWRYRAFDANAPNNCHIYQLNNLVDGDRDGKRDGVNIGWSMFTDTYTKAYVPYAFETVNTQSATDAYYTVLEEVGATPWNRDAIDAAIISDVINETGHVIDSQSEVGGWPALDPGTPPVDSDWDGMPDTWELWYGTDPATADNNGGLGPLAYTNLEQYLQWLIDAETVSHPGDADRNDAVSLGDLAIMAGNWDRTGMGWEQGDFNNDGHVSIGDLAIMAGNWNWSWPGDPIPEPLSLATLGLGSLALLRRRR